MNRAPEDTLKAAREVVVSCLGEVPEFEKRWFLGGLKDDTLAVRVAVAALAATPASAAEPVGWIDQQGLNKLRHGWSSTIYPERVESDDLTIPLHQGITIDTR